MKKIEKEAVKIHYINNLWHLSMLLGNEQFAEYFQNRKNELQRKFLNKYKDDVNVMIDETVSDNSGKVYSIKINNSDYDACHIPENKLEY